MNDNNNRSFFEEFLKWFFILNIIALLFKGIVFLIKIFFIAMQQLIYLIVIGIAKVSPILKEKFANFKNNYNTKYKFEIEEKWQNVLSSFQKMKDRIKETLGKIRIKIPERNKKVKREKLPSRVGKSKPALRIKKFKYAIIELFYRYELQIVVFIIILIITVGIALGLKFLR